MRAAVRRWLDRIKGRGQRSECLILFKALLSFARSRGLAEPAGHCDYRRQEPAGADLLNAATVAESLTPRWSS